MYKKILAVIIIFFSIKTAKAQLYHLDANGCTFSHPLGNATTLGNPKCFCGIPDDALFLDGIDDALVLPDTLLKKINEDFTIDFYVSVKNIGDELIDIFSIGNQCQQDSLLTIKYIKSTETLLVELLNNGGEYYAIKGPMSGLCWNRVTLTKSKLVYSLYINNVETGKAIALQKIPFAKSAKLAFANSPCLATIDEKLEGTIDEISIYDKAINTKDLNASFLFPDRIENVDTTIFAGNSVELKFLNSCASNINWSPATSLSSSSDKVVIATPTETTTYTLTASYDECLIDDKVTVYVLDSDNANCENLLLPDAFTPNDDFLNDVYKISNVFIIQELKSFDILDRWGELLFTTKDKNDGWDGYYLQKKAEPATFVYRVNYTCQGKEFQKLGSFVLLK